MREKIFFYGYPALFFLTALYLLITGFFQPCYQATGERLHCSLTTGQAAIISAPARITILDTSDFKISYVDLEGRLIEPKVLTSIGYRFIDIITEGPTVVTMISSGGIAQPIIYVSQTDTSKHPTLKVVRTWLSPFTQLIQWHLFFPFLLCLAFGISFILFTRRYLE